MIGALAVPQLVQPTSSSSSIALNLDLICSSHSTGKATLETAAPGQGKEAICKQPNRGYVRWSAPRHQLHNLTSCGWFMCKVRFLPIIHSASPISLRCGSLTWNALIDFNPWDHSGGAFPELSGADLHYSLESAMCHRRSKRLAPCGIFNFSKAFSFLTTPCLDFGLVWGQKLWSYSF
jgi:hypothetical protein